MYKIKKFDYSTLTNYVWDIVSPIYIDKFPWDKSNYKPTTSVKLFYTNETLKIKFTSTEKKVRVEEIEFNSSTYQDSCVEFFFKPNPNSDNRYFNFEITASGTLLIQLDDKLRERKLLTAIDPSIFNIKTDINKLNHSEFDNFKPWNVEFEIPFSFIKNYFANFNPKSGYIIKGNFYKCGDKTEIPHYGCWNEVFYHKPSFHRPEFFGELIFE